jgi:hypothetical protein
LSPAPSSMKWYLWSSNFRLIWSIWVHVGPEF